ncbi:uncharacterized protein LOC133527896 [Cydia pomonella]|uniref:uncharacterized protein LOC133527896 n=1 Tax=Cydia pomonella TaxID=82600 RepID=UPI002ADD3AFA|nr:uncharacterized protein LOC133527896 [Cydia pomonella]
MTFSVRPVIVSALRSLWWPTLRKFMVQPVIWAVENDEPMEFLTEIRRVVVIFLNIVTKTVTDEMLVEIVDTAYKCVYSTSSAAGGLLNKVSLFDKDLMFLLVFGLRGMSHGDEAQKSLLCAQALKERLIDPNIISVSIGISSGTTYCGVVGHVLRREYTVIGRAANKAARLMTAYPNKLVCDKETFLRSKMDQDFFRLMEFIPMKGIQRPGPVYEFNKYGSVNRYITANGQRPSLPFDVHVVTEILSHPVTQIFKMLYPAQNDLLYTPIRFNPYFCGQPVYCQIEHSSLDLNALTPVEIYAINIIFGCRLALPDNFEFPNDILEESCTKKLVRNIFQNNIPAMCIVAIEEGMNIDDESWRLLLVLLDTKTIFVIMTLTDKTSMSGKVLFSYSKSIILLEKQLMHDKTYLESRFSTVAQSPKFRLSRVKISLSELPYPAFVYRATVPYVTLLNCTNNFPPTEVALQCLSSNKLLQMPLSGLSHWYHLVIACQFLDVQAVPTDLEKLIQSASNGVPGWIQDFIISLVQRGDLTVETTTRAKALEQGAVMPTPSLLCTTVTLGTTSDNQVSLDAYFKVSCSTEVLGKFSANDTDKFKSSDVLALNPKEHIQIAVLADTFDVLNIRMSVDADVMIMKTYDSLTPFEKMLLKCCSVLGVVFSRQMMEYLVECDSRSKIAKAVAKLFSVRVLECEGGDFTQETSKVLVHRSPAIQNAQPPYCSCRGTKELINCADLPKYAFCGYMRFKSTLFQTTTYDLLTEIQKYDLHGRALLYLKQYTRRCWYCGEGCLLKLLGRRTHDGLVKVSTDLKNTQEMIQSLADESHHVTGELTRSRKSAEHLKLEDVIARNPDLDLFRDYAEKISEGTDVDGILMYNFTPLTSVEVERDGTQNKHSKKYQTLLSCCINNYCYQFHSSVMLRIFSDELLRFPGQGSEIGDLPKSDTHVRSFSSLDVANCECLSIALAAYDQLINHCRGAGEHEKLFEAYLEYADLCVNSNTPQALCLLNEAETVIMVSLSLIFQLCISGCHRASVAVVLWFSLAAVTCLPMVDPKSWCGIYLEPGLKVCSNLNHIEPCEYCDGPPDRPLFIPLTQLCVLQSDEYWSNCQLNCKISWFKDFCLGRIVSLRGGCMLASGELIEARKHLHRALELFRDPFPTTKRYQQMIRNMHISVRQWMAFKVKPKAFIGTVNGLICFFYEEVAITLNRLYTLFVGCKEYSNAELTAKWSFDYALRSNSNFKLLCECYGNMITTHFNNQELSKCVKIVNMVIELCRRKRGQLDDAEARAVCVLYTTVFLFFVEYGKKNESLNFGLPVMHMVSMLRESGMRVRLVVSLLRLLLSDLRINEMVLLMRENLYMDGEFDLSSTTWYYTYSLMILIETGYCVESYQECESFYMQHGDTILAFKSKDAAWDYFGCMWLITVRVCAWETSVLWEKKVKEIMATENKQIEYKINLQLILLEGWLIMLVREIDAMNENQITIIKETIKNMFEMLSKYCPRAPIYQPRYFLLLAYFNFIRGNKFHARSYLEKTFELAKELAEGTILIWAEHTRQHWMGTLDPELEDYWVEHIEPDNLLDYRNFNKNVGFVPYTLPLPKRFLR